jgi:protein involved in polysaccharide export with SLBB domain
MNSRQSRFRAVLARLAILGVVAAVSAGCSTPPPAKSGESVLSLPDENVRLAPGDSIEVKFFYSSDLNDLQTVRPDGKITLQLVGDVVAGGRTPDELQAELVRLYATRLEKPDVAVIVRELKSRIVYVGGAVNEPGEFELLRPVTALDAVMQAGGFEMDKAEYRKVVVIRREKDRYTGYGLDFEKALTGQECKPFFLRSGDLVFVPRTRISDMNLWVEQHITRMIPQIGLPVFFQVN